MQLYDPATGETFECPQGWPSERHRKAIAQVSLEKAQAFAENSKKYPSVVAAQKLTLKERQDLFRDQPDLNAEATAYNNTAQEILNRAVRLECRAGLETRNLSPDRRALIESDIDGDFWLEQSVPALEEAVERFQKGYLRGRSGDRKDPAVAGDEAAVAEPGAGSVPAEADGVGEQTGSGE